MTAGRKTVKPKFDVAAFEIIIDALHFPLERDEVRMLLKAFCEEAMVRTHDGDGLLRKYRCRRPGEIVKAVLLRLNEGNPNCTPYEVKQ